MNENMSGTYCFCLDEDLNLTEADIIAKYLDDEMHNRKRHFAVIIIQTIWRGYSARKKIKRWHKSATVIQKWFRGWLVRHNFISFLKTYFYNASIRYYNKQASIIQAHWKGYMVRKNLNMKEIIQTRTLAVQASETTQQMLREYLKKSRNVMTINGIEVENNMLTECLCGLYGKHHLLRTHQIEGPLSIHNSKKFSKLEELLKSTPFSWYQKELGRIKDFHKHEIKNRIPHDEDGKLVHTKPFCLFTKIREPCI